MSVAKSDRFWDTIAGVEVRMAPWAGLGGWRTARGELHNSNNDIGFAGFGPAAIGFEGWALTAEQTFKRKRGQDSLPGCHADFRVGRASES